MGGVLGAISVVFFLPTALLHQVPDSPEMLARLQIMVDGEPAKGLIETNWDEEPEFEIGWKGGEPLKYRLRRWGGWCVLVFGIPGFVLGAIAWRRGVRDRYVCLALWPIGLSILLLSLTISIP